MTWFRKHWPDVIILFFIVLILAGAVLILFGGTRKLFNLSSTQAPVQTAQETPQVEEIPLNPAPTTAAAPETEEKAQPENQTQTGALTPESAAPATTTANPATAAESATSQSTTQQEAESIPVIPAQGESEVGSTANAGASTGGTSTPTSTTPPVQASSAQSNPAATEPASKPEVDQTPQNPSQPAAKAITGRAPTKQDYRISAGLYQTEAQASTVAERIKGLGYPTYVYPSKDDNYVVLIGPFANRNDADTAVSQIQSVHQNLFVYAPQNPPADATSSATTAPAAVPSSATTAPSGPVYLQVGAYKRADSAVPAIDQLRSLGFNPSLRTDTNGMVRVVVGPFTAGDLSSAQSKLQGAGYTDAFQIR